MRVLPDLPVESPLKLEQERTLRVAGGFVERIYQTRPIAVATLLAIERAARAVDRAARRMVVRSSQDACEVEGRAPSGSYRRFVGIQ